MERFIAHARWWERSFPLFCLSSAESRLKYIYILLSGHSDWATLVHCSGYRCYLFRGKVFHFVTRSKICEAIHSPLYFPYFWNAWSLAKNQGNFTLLLTFYFKPRLSTFRGSLIRIIAQCVCFRSVTCTWNGRDRFYYTWQQMEMTGPAQI